jgi:hypothetical protein
MKNLATCAVPAIRSKLLGPSLLFAPPSVYNPKNPHSFVVRGGVRSTDFGSAFELISEIDVTRQGTTQDNSGHFGTSCEQLGRNAAFVSIVSTFQPRAETPLPPHACATSCSPH